MSGDKSVDLIWAVGCLALLGSAMLRRRIPIGQAAKLASIWIAIFAVTIGIVAFHNDFRNIWSALKTRIDPEAGAVAGTTLRIPMADDGHFWVRGEVNGVSLRFLVDSGATMTSLNANDARASGIDPAGEALGMPTETANGMIVARRIAIRLLQVGPIERRNLAAMAAPEFGETNVLGMNFLSSLHRWGVEGDVLILES